MANTKKSMKCGQVKKSTKSGKKIMKKYCGCPDTKDGEKLVHAGAKGYGNNYSNKARKSFKSRHNCDTAKPCTPRHLACKELWKGPSGRTTQPPKLMSPLRKKSPVKLMSPLRKKKESLHDWFEKSKGTTKDGKKVKGWVQIGGKYDGKPCARQPGQTTTPKCVSSSKRNSMSKSERESSARRKREKDPDQPNKKGSSKPTYVSTDTPKKKKKKKLSPKKETKKDACYYETKAKFKVWPSAYGSGQLVQCRKRRAKGKSKK